MQVYRKLFVSRYACIATPFRGEVRHVVHLEMERPAVVAVKTASWHYHPREARLRNWMPVCSELPKLSSHVKL